MEVKNIVKGSAIMHVIHTNENEHFA